MFANQDIWDHGVSVAVLIAVALAIIWFCRFFAKEIIKPIRNNLIGRIVTFFDKLDATIDKLEVSHTAALEMLARHEIKLEEIGASCARMERDWPWDEPTERKPRQQSHPRMPPGT